MLQILTLGSNISCLSPNFILDKLGSKPDNLKSRDDELKMMSPRLEVIVSKINSLTDMIQGMNFSDIVITNEKLPANIRNPNLLYHTQELERGVKAVLSTASTVAKPESTVRGSSGIKTASSSAYGDILDESRRANTKRWVLQSNIREKSSPQTEVNPNVKQDSWMSTDKHFNESQDPKFGIDSEIEVDLINELFAEGQREYAEDRYDAAIQCFESGLRRAAKTTGKRTTVLERRKIKLKLAFSYMHKGDLPTSERLFRDLMREPSDNSSTVHTIHAFCGLAQIRLCQGSFKDAEIWCQKAMTESKRSKGKENPLYINALELIELIYEVKGDSATAAAFAYLAAEACIKAEVQSDFARLDQDSCWIRGFIVSYRNRKRSAEMLLSNLGLDPKIQGSSEEGRKLIDKALLILVRAETGHGLRSSSKFTVTAQYLLDKGAHVNAKDKFHNVSALFYASHQGHDGIVRLLCERGADANHANSLGDTPLITAARNGHVAIVKILCEQGVDPNAGIICKGMKDKTQWVATAIEEAAFRGHTSVVELLLSKGVDIEARNTINNYTALLAAASQGHELTVRCLLKARANVNARSAKGFTALHKAAAFASEALFGALLARGPSLEARTNEGSTALIIAAKNDNPLGVEILLDAGADLEGQDERKRTALSWAVIEKAANAMRTLLSRGASSGLPLYLACLRGLLPAVKSLLEAGANPNANCDESGTCLITAAQHGYNEVLILLLEYRASLEARSSRSLTALFTAAICSHLETVEILLNAGANIDSKDSYGATAAMAIIKEMGKTCLPQHSKRRGIEILRLLCDRGTDVSLQDHKGKTALHWASQAKSADKGTIIRILRDHGAE